VDRKIFNSRGVHVAIVLGPAIFDLKGQKVYDLRGVNIYKLSGELVGHLTDAQSRWALVGGCDMPLPIAGEIDALAALHCQRGYAVSSLIVWMSTSA
jgi:hypothetical protein